MKLKENKMLNQLISVIISFVIPAIGTYFAVLLWKEDNSFFAKLGINYEVYTLIITAIFALMFLLIYFKVVPCFKCLRVYGKYEGCWIEIIPNFPRSISICRIYYKDGEYHFDGTNYGLDNHDPVKFQSQKIVVSEKDEFFYISKSNQQHLPVGFGKVYCISNSNGEYYTANGYFVDVCSTGDSIMHNTKMIKFEEKFYNSFLVLKPGENPKKFTDKEIYDHVKDYIKSKYKMVCNL